MSISVVIPLYNKESNIRDTLQSVVSQTLPPAEVIVVDDGSTDGSAQVVDTFITDLKSQSLAFPVYLIRKSNGGVCSARNMGIREAQSEYIALLDADDKWDKDYLREQVRMITDFPEAAMWGINYAEVYEGKLIRCLRTGLPDDYRGYVEGYFQLPDRSSDLFCSSSVVIDKKVFREVGLFDERLRYSEDVDMWFRIIATHRVAFYDRYMVFYQYDAANRAMNRKRLLRYWLPYYADKYKVPPFADNKVFYEWIMRWCAVCIKRVYFSDESQRDDARNAISKLDFSCLPYKYNLFFRLPYKLAFLLYRWDEKRRAKK